MIHAVEYISMDAKGSESIIILDIGMMIQQFKLNYYIQKNQMGMTIL